MPKAVIFGDGKCSPKTKKYKSAVKLAELLGAMGFDIVNGGYAGVMEASASGASKFAVERIGVVLENSEREPNKFLTKRIFAPSYLDRLELLIDMGDVYFFFEGGSGTLLECSAVLALYERNIIRKPTFYIGQKWSKLYNFLKNNFKINIGNYAHFHFFEKFEAKEIELISEMLKELLVKK